MVDRLAGKRALITGAASGVGREIARYFHEEGATLALLDIDGAGVAATAKDLAATGVRCDVRDPAMIEAAVADGLAALGGLDILVNAAGILFRQPFESIDPAQWQTLFEVNLRGPALLCKAALPALRLGSGANIVNVASLSAIKPSPGTSAYAASKGGLLMLTKCLAEELAPIRVNAICPGIIDTPMTQGFMADPATRERIERSNALHLIGEPADIAAAAVYLASDEARFTTGTQMVIDGGSSYA